MNSLAPPGMSDDRCISPSSRIFQRPLTIFEGENPTLDPNAITHAMRPPDRLLPGALTLTICLMMGLGVVFMPDVFACNNSERAWGTPKRINEVRVLLTEEVLDKHTPEPANARSGGGQGGTGTVDPRHARVAVETAATTPVETLRIEDLPMPTLQNISLPRAPGGDGLSRGRGHGTGGGTGGGHGAGSGFGKAESLPDHMLVSTKRPTHVFQLKPEQNQGPCTVVVSITIEADGRVSHAKAISGPVFLHSAAEQCAMKWEFEPLGPHGLSAPYRTSVSFHYRNPKVIA